MECAEDGFAFLFQDEGAGSHDEDGLVHWVTELLPKSLCERDSANDGEGLYVLEKGGDSPGRCTELASLQNAGVECEAKLRPSQLCAHLVCKCEIFRLPRAGFRLWWQLQGVFTMCGFTNVAGRSGSWWVHRYWKVWKKWLTDLSMGDSLRKCGEAAAEGGVRGEAPELREVRWPSASAPGLVALLSRLSFAPRHSGGLKSEGDRAACRQVLTTLIGSVIDQEWVWEVFMGDDGLHWDPPRPMQGSGRLLVPVCAGGIADILSMCSHLAPQRAIFAQRMVAQYCHSEDIARVTAVDFLAALQACAPGRGIKRVAADRCFMQLCVAIGSRLDGALGAAWDGLRNELPGVQVQKCGFDFLNKQQRDRLNANYWMQLQAAGQAHSHLPIPLACDFTLVGKRNIFD